MTEQFQEKAHKLMSKLSNLNSNSNLNKSSKLQVNSNQSYSLNELHKFHQQIQLSDAQNKRKIKVLNDQIFKLQTYLLEQNQARNKISQNFVLTATKVQKNMKLTLSNIRKNFEQKQKKLQNKIQQIIQHQKKQMEINLVQNQNLLEQIGTLSKQIKSLEQELEQMKRSRYQLQDKIYKQFIDQIKQLRKIYQRDIKQRQERQNNLIECLKIVYKTLMEQIRKEEIQRELTQKGFLQVVQQIINRIVDY